MQNNLSSLSSLESHSEWQMFQFRKIVCHLSATFAEVQNYLLTVFPSLQQNRKKHCSKTHAESIGDLTCLERHKSTGVTPILLQII